MLDKAQLSIRTLRLFTLSFSFFSFNNLLNSELPRHPSIFLFMNRLQSNIYENSISLVAQVNAGRQTKYRATLEAQRLAKRARQVEENYDEGLLSATEVLQNASVHYNDDRLIEVFRQAADNEELQPEENTPSSSK